MIRVRDEMKKGIFRFLLHVTSKLGEIIERETNVKDK